MSEEKILKSQNKINDIETAYNYELQEPLDLNFMTARKIRQKLRQRQVQKGKQYIKLVTQVLYTLIFISVVFMQLEITNKHDMHVTIKDLIGKKAYYDDPMKTVYDIFHDFEFFVWYKLAFSEVALVKADGTQWVQEQNYLVGQNLSLPDGSYQATVRRINQVENESTFWEYMPIIREVPWFDPRLKVQPGEDTSSLDTAQGEQIEYEYDEGFFRAGGYFLYAPADKSIYDLIVTFIFKEYLDGTSVNSQVISFVSYNGNYNYFCLNSVIIIRYPGGDNDIEVEVQPFRLQLYSTDLDIMRATLEVVLFIGFFFMFSSQVRKIIRELKKLHKDEKEIFSRLSASQQKIRKRMKPSLVSRLHIVFNRSTIPNFLFYVFFISSFGFWIEIVRFSYDDQIPLMVENVDYFNGMNYLVYLYHAYISLLGLTLLFLSIKTARILDIINIDSRISTLQKTLFSAAPTLFFFCLFMVSIIFGFSCMGFIAFGTYSPHFQTLGTSMITCIQIFLLNFDYDTMFKDSVLGNVFFIFFLFLQYFVLLNIFIAILEQSYARVKANQDDSSSEKVEFFQSIWQYCKSLCAKLGRHDVNLPMEKVKPSYILLMLSLGMEIREASSFGDTSAQEIIMEKMHRVKVKEQVQHIINSYESETTFRTTYKEIKAITKFWKYARQLNLHQNKAAAVIRKKTERLYEESKFFNRKEKRWDKRMDRKYKYIQKLEDELEKQVLDMQLLKVQKRKNKPKHKDTVRKAGSKPNALAISPEFNPRI